MLGLINIVKCGCAPVRSRGGAGGLLLGLVVLVLVTGGAAALVRAVGSAAPSFAAANAAVGSAISILVTVVLILAALGFAAWGAWALVDRRRGQRATADFDRRNPGVRGAVTAGRPRRAAVASGHQVRHQVTSRRLDQLEEPAPVNLDAVLRGRR